MTNAGKHNLKRLSGPKAAEELERYAKTGLKFDTLYKYVRAFSKRERFMEEHLPQLQIGLADALQIGKENVEASKELEKFITEFKQKMLDEPL